MDTYLLKNIFTYCMYFYSFQLKQANSTIDIHTIGEIQQFFYNSLLFQLQTQINILNTKYN